MAQLHLARGVRARLLRRGARGRGCGAVSLVAAGLLVAGVLTGGCGGLGDSGGVSTTDVSSTAPGSTAAPSSTTETPSSTTIPYATTTSAASTTTVTRPPDPVAIPDGGREVVSLADAGNVVALTFDAAYAPAPLGDILEALTTAGVPATFFLTGEFAADFPDDVAAIHAAGFPIGNHSYSHPDFTALDASGIKRELDRTREALAAAGVPDPRPLFRFPYGARDSRTLALVGAEGYLSVYWTIDTLDWKPERTPAEVREAILSRVAPGSIVLMHVGSRQTAEVLPQVIAELKARGYGFVDLGWALAGSPGANE